MPTRGAANITDGDSHLTGRNGGWSLEDQWREQDFTESNLTHLSPVKGTNVAPSCRPVPPWHWYSGRHSNQQPKQGPGIDLCHLYFYACLARLANRTCRVVQRGAACTRVACTTNDNTMNRTESETTSRLEFGWDSKSCDNTASLESKRSTHDAANCSAIHRHMRPTR